MADLVRTAELTTPVPSCPGWDVGRLAVHVGAIHRWAAAMVAVQSPVWLDRREVDDANDGRADDLAGWLAAGAALVAGMSSADPDAPMWAWGADQHVRFWPRRMLHETTVHMADVALALGVEPPIDAAVAADGIDEFLDNLPKAVRFAPKVSELRGEGSLHLHGTDGDAEWMIEFTREGFGWRHAHGKASVAVRGRSAELLLLMYGRRRADDECFAVFGDRAVLAKWVANSAI